MMHLFQALLGRFPNKVAVAFVLFESATIAPATAQDLYVAYQANNTIEKFASTGSSVSSTGAAFTTNSLVGPLGLAFDSAGNLYAANYGNASTNGESIVEYKAVDGAIATTATQVTNKMAASPLDMAFDSSGNMFVTCRGTGGSGNEIMEFPLIDGAISGNGKVFTTTGADRPWGLAFDKEGSLYVSFSGETGSYIEKYGSVGGALSAAGTVFSRGDLVSPADLAFDKAGNLYVAAKTVEKYTCTDDALSSTGTVFDSNGLYDPRGLAFDAAGSLYVSYGSGPLVKYVSTGGILSNTGIQFNDNGFEEPGGLAFSPFPASAPSSSPTPSSTILPWIILASLGLSAAGGLYLAKRYGHRNQL